MFRRRFVLLGIPAGAKIDKNVAVRAKAYQLSLLPRGTSNAVAEGDGESEPHGHGMPCPYSARFVIFSIAKNLSIRVIRFFTRYDSVRVVCVILSTAKNLSIHGIRYFTSLRSVQYDNCVRCHF